MMKKIKWLLYITILLSNSAYAMLNFSGRGEGLSRTYSVFASGFDAVAWNPANLILSPKFSFNILSIGMEYSSNLSVGDWIKIASHGYFNDEDKKIFQNGLSFGACGGAQAISFSWKNIAFTSCLITKNAGEIPSDFTKMIFWGNIPEIDSVYSFNGTQGVSEIALDVGVSAAQLIASDNFAIGATIKYLEGFSYMDAKLDGGLKTTFDTTDIAASTIISGNGSAVLRYAEGGTGFGVDIGALYFNKDYNMGISVINILSGMEWLENPAIDSLTFTVKPTDLEHFDPDTSVKWDTTTITGRSFSTREDMSVKLGCSINKKTMNVAAEIGYPQWFGMGAEIPYKAVVFRTGVGLVKAISKSNLWIGLGIGTKFKLLHADIGVRVSPTTSMSAALGLTILPEEKIDKAFGQ
ncbi:MAG: DUF5723 family protein [bacterium]|nr:DUF5723 family protein [bacterium]